MVTSSSRLNYTSSRDVTLALSLPEAWSAAVVVIVLQSLVELLGMVAFLRWVPTLLIK